MARNDNEESASCDSVMAPMTSDYNTLNQSQSTVWPFAKPLFATAMQDGDCNSGDSFRVADLGCATGGNSLAPLSFLAAHLARRSTEGQSGKVSSTAHHRNCILEVFLCDLPSNAWDTVATTVTPSAISSAAQQGPHEETVNGMANVQMDNFYHLSS